MYQKLLETYRKLLETYRRLLNLLVSQQPSPIFYFKIPSASYHVAMVRRRSLGPQWLRGQGVTPLVSSDCKNK